MGIAAILEALSAAGGLIQSLNGLVHEVIPGLSSSDADKVRAAALDLRNKNIALYESVHQKLLDAAAQEDTSKTKSK